MSQNKTGHSANQRLLSVMAECDSLIKMGNINHVAERLAGITLSKVPRELRQPLAKVYRRAGLVDTGLRLLFPIIRSEKPLDNPPSLEEIAEYAFLLARNGSRQEAINLLKDLDPAKAPSALLYRACCEIENWNYATSAELLEVFIRRPVDHYAKLIGGVNLIASYLALGKLEEAEVLLLDTIVLAESQGAGRLVGNCYELKGGLHVLQGQFGKAREALDKALQIFGEGESYDQLLILKWRAIIDAFQNKNTEPLKVFRQRAVARNHWESVREADLFSLKIEFEQRAFDHLFFGTPMPGYRAWLASQIPRQPSPFYLLGSSHPQLELNIENGAVQGAESELNAGKKVHQVIAALITDFYLPQSMGSLFAQLYPGEYFNVQSSPNRVRQVLHRARVWLEEEGIPAAIECTEGRYHLSIHGSFAVWIPLEREVWNIHYTRWQQIKSHYPSERGFTAKEGADQLGLSQTSFHRFLQWAMDKGLLAKMGGGKTTFYKVSDGDSVNQRKIG